MRVSVKMFGLLAVLVLAMGFVFQGTARADPPTPFPVPGDGLTNVTVPTTAEVSATGGGAEPVVNYKWENVDMSKAEGSWAYFDGSDNADDDPACPGLQFWPWLDDDPVPGGAKECRQVRYWAAVDDPNGLNDIDPNNVWVNVYEPWDDDGDTLVNEDPIDGVDNDGDTKIDEDPPDTKLDNDGDTLVDEDPVDGRDNDGDTKVDEDPPDGHFKYKQHLAPMACSDIGTYVATGPVITLGPTLKAAVQTGQLTLEQAQDAVEKCYNLGKKIYMGQNCVSKEQPAGEYTVEAIARDFEGNDSVPKINYFTVLSIVGLRIDFTAGVNFGNILPGTEKVVVGDAAMVAGDGHPTVQNIGNDPMYLWLHWYKMVGHKTQPMEIIHFDAIFQGEQLYYEASVERGFCEHLCANEIKKLDLSIEPQTPLYGDTYTGSLDVQGAHQPDPECKALPRPPKPPWAP